METRRSAMLNAYMEVARLSSRDDAYKQRLLDEPREALTAQGFDLPAGTDVEVTFVDAAGTEGRSAEQAAATWEQQIADGRLQLQLPDHLPASLETQELSDEQLARASGGEAGDVFCMFF